MINNSTIGQRIRAAREKSGMTQAEFATKLGYISPTAISLIESGERSVKVETLEKIADVLSQDVSYLATGRESPKYSVKTALRADSSYNAEEVEQIENFIDFLMTKKQDNGRRPDKKN